MNVAWCEGMKKKYVIISGGSIDDECACNIIEKGCYDVILAADSGMNFLYRRRMKPDIIIGDFDSVDVESLAYFKEQDGIEFHQLNPMKDDTDTEYAIRYAIAHGATAITVIGGTGTRLDHVLGNVSLLGIGLEEGIPIELVDANNRIRMVDKPLSIRRTEQYGKYVSLIPYAGEVCDVTLEGMKYPLDHYLLGGFNSLGVSNEIEADEAHISFSKGLLLVIESRD